MELEVGGANRFLQIRRNAYWAHIHLDSRFSLYEAAKVDMVCHLKDCIENPTRGLLARREQTGKRLNYPGYYELHKKQIAKLQEVKQLNDVFESKLVTMYPKTLSVRNYLIKNDNVVLNRVKKVSAGLKHRIFKFLYLLK